MKFELRKFSEEEIREYNVSDSDNKYAPEGGVIDVDNNVRFIFYRKQIVMEPCNISYFVFDYKGKMNVVAIRETIKDNKTIYDLTGTDKLLNDDERKSLREAIKVYGNRGFLKGIMRDKSDRIIINF